MERMLDLLDPNTRIVIVGDKTTPNFRCAVCGSKNPHPIRSRGAKSNIVAGVCSLHAGQLMATRNSRRRDAYGVTKHEGGLGPSMPRPRFHDSLSPSFVSAEHAVFHLTKAQIAKRKAS